MTQPILPLIIYHDNCADGFGAAWAAYKKFGADGAEYLPMNYNDPRVNYYEDKVNFQVDVKDRDVYIVDFSFKAAIFGWLITNTTKLVWLDHHKTAFEEYGLDPKKLNEQQVNHVTVILDPNKSGCVLAWEHFHPNDEVPMLLKYIEDRDIWRWQYTSTRDLATGLRSKPFSFNWFDTASENLAAVIAKGESMNELFDQQLADITKKQMVVMINGNLGRAVNCTPQFSSEAGNILAKQSGTFGMTWCVNDKGEVNVSLRSIGDYDVSAIAKTFGGGGHRNAAGLKIPFNNLYFKDGMLTLTS